MIILATEYDAMTGALNAIDIRGRGGAPSDVGARAAHLPRPEVAGFPTCFL
jgi:hypothetical protein